LSTQKLTWFAKSFPYKFWWKDIW